MDIQIDMFEEILDYLQKVRSYDTLSSEVLSKVGLVERNFTCLLVHLNSKIDLDVLLY